MTAVIEDIRFFPLRSPLNPPASFAWGSAAERNVGLVRVCVGGQEGWGETSVTFPLWSLEERSLTVRNLAPLFHGAPIETVDDIEVVCERVRKATAPLTHLWSPVAISAAVGAIEMALTDALLKRFHRSALDEFHGTGNPLPLYAVGFQGDADRIAEQAAAAISAGYRAVKIRVGFDPDRDLRLLRTVREAVGDSPILVDANMAWNRDDAADAIRAMSRYSPAWIEEPLAPDDVEGLAALRRRFPDIPFAAGENCYDERQLNHLVDAEAVDVLMPDLARCGGFLVALRAARRANKRGIRVSPHHYASDIGFSADTVLAAALGDGQRQKIPVMLLRDVSSWPLRENVAGHAFTTDTGVVTPYAGEGLSPSPDPAVLNRWTIDADGV